MDEVFHLLYSIFWTLGYFSNLQITAKYILALSTLTFLRTNVRVNTKPVLLPRTYGFNNNSDNFSCTRDEQFGLCLFFYEFNLFLIPSLWYESFFLNGSQKWNDNLWMFPFTTKGTNFLEDMGTDESIWFRKWKLQMDRIPLQWNSLAFSIEQLALAWVERLPAMSWRKQGNVGFYLFQKTNTLYFQPF